MGSCISKCRSKKRSKSKEEEEEDSTYFVQDKVVISQQAPVISSSTTYNKNNIPLPNTKSTKKPFSPSLSPPSPSTSSFSCTTSNTTISSCSSSSSSSSVLSSKDRSFSNDFLWSCVKENPHIIRVNPIKPSSIINSSTVPVAKIHAQKLESLAKPTASPIASQPIPQRVAVQKRARTSSPILTRQKSFRRESDQRLNCRTITRSPSPSRRFTGDNYYRNIMTSTGKESCCKSSVGSRTNPVHQHQQHILSSMRRENLRPASPNNNSGRHRSCLKSREMFSHPTGSKIDEVAIGEVLSKMEVDTVPMEDIDNPHISLDCFIFL